MTEEKVSAEQFLKEIREEESKKEFLFYVQKWGKRLQLRIYKRLRYASDIEIFPRLCYDTWYECFVAEWLWFQVTFYLRWNEG